MPRNWKTKRIVLPFLCEDGSNGLVNLAVVEFNVRPSLSSRQALAALKKVLTQWVKTTKDGRTAWKQSSEDFNIGDLSLCEEDFKRYGAKGLEAQGVYSFNILYCGDVADAETFDTILIDKAKL